MFFLFNRIYREPANYVTKTWRFVLFVLLTQYCAGDKIEKNEMGWACGAYG